MIIGQIIINGLMLGAIYVLVAVGFTLVFSIMRVVNFAHGEFYMLGSFAILLFAERLGFPFALALLASALAVAFLGGITERLIFSRFRNDELSAMIASLGLALIIQNLVLIAFGPSPYQVDSPVTGALVLGSVVIPLSRLFVSATAFIIFCAFWLLMMRSRFGRAMRALAQDPEAAKLQGISVSRLFPTGFGLAVGLAAVAGALMAPLFSVSPFGGHGPMLKSFIVVVLGGLGSVPGAAVGGILLGMAESFSGTFLSSGIADILQILLVVAILLVRPNGLMGKVGARP